MKRLVKFHGQGGYYMLDLICIKVVDEDEWELLQRILREPTTLYLGEIAGKHSDVIWDIEEEEIKVLGTGDHVDMFLELFPSGFVGNIDIFGRIYDHYQEH